jgi:hypothetical protein
MNSFCSGLIVYGLLALLSGGVLSHLVVYRFFRNGQDFGVWTKLMQLVATVIVGIVIFALEMSLIFKLTVAFC